jgi:hypothetical protein
MKQRQDFQGLSVCVLPATDITRSWISPTTGVASVSVIETPEAVHELLTKSGTPIVDNLQKRKIAAAGASVHQLALHFVDIEPTAACSIVCVAYAFQ